MNPYTSYGRTSADDEDDEEEQQPLKSYGTKRSGKTKRRNPYTSYGQDEDNEEDQASRLEKETAKRIEQEEKGKDKRSLFSKVYDQLNMTDNARTFKQKDAQNKKTFVQQAQDVGTTFFAGTEKLGDSVEALTGVAERRQEGWDRELREGKIDRKEYQRRLQDSLEDTEWAGTEDRGTGDRLKKGAGVAAETVSEFLPIPAGRVAKGASTGRRLLKAGAANAAVGAAGAIGGELSDEDGFDLKNVGVSAALGGVMGAGGALSRKADLTPEQLDAQGRAAKSDVDVDPKALDEIEKSLKAEDDFRIDTERKIADTPLLLGSGEDTARARLAEVDDALNRVAKGEVGSKYEDVLPGSVDEAGIKPAVAANPAAMQRITETRTKMDEELAAIDEEVAQIELKRQETTLDGVTASENMKNAQMQFRNRLEEIQNTPHDELAPELQAALIRQADEEYQAALTDTTTRFTNSPELNKTFDQAIAEAEARKVEVTSRYEDQLGDIEGRAAMLETSRQEAIQEMSPEEIRSMMRERKELQEQIDSIEYSKTLAPPEGGDAPSIDIKQAAKDNPAIAQTLEDNLDNSVYKFDDANPDKTVGFIQGALGTQENILRDAGLGDTWGRLQDGQHKHDFALQQDMEKMAELAKSIGGNKERAGKVFDALDTGDPSKLDASETAAYDWFKTQFEKLADVQGLPQESRISGYVTHLFDGARSKRLLKAQQQISSGDFLTDAQKKKYAGNEKRLESLNKAGERRARKVLYESDPDLLRLMKKNANGNIKNKFTDEKRTGVEGFERDPFNAYRVYADKAYMKVHMEEPLQELAAAKPAVSKSMGEYINDQINMIKKVPSEQRKYQERINNSIDTLGKAIEWATRGKVKTDAAAFERGTKFAAKQIYRGTLQFNPGTAITNFTQMANTYGELGRWTPVGFSEASGHIKKGDTTELHEMGVLEGTLSDALIGDDSLLKGMMGKVGDKSDKVGWFMFQKVEEINRATAYYGAKRKALAEGKPEAEAKKYAAGIARKTQFKFSNMDTPHALQGPIAKNLTQLLTFSVKQAEYLKRAGWDDFIVPTAQGDWGLSKQGAQRLARIALGYTAMGATIGQLTGVGSMDFGEIAQGDFSSMGNTVKDNIPFYQYVSEGNLPASPLVTFLAGSDRGIGVANLFTGKNEHGNDTDRGELATELVTEKAPRLFLPGGSQYAKTSEGMTTAGQGYSETDSGNVRFGVEGGLDKFKAGLFGQYNTTGGRDYVKDGFPTFSATESEMYKAASPARRAMYEDFFKANDKVPKQKDASDEVTRIVKEERNIERAQNKATEYNVAVDQAFQSVFDEYPGMVPKELKEYVQSKKISPLRSDIKSRR